MSKKADSFMRCNTLACVVGMSLGKVTTVELRNESYATGTVAEVNPFPRNPSFQPKIYFFKKKRV